MRVYFPVPRNGVTMKTFSPQNDCTTELNINFLLTRTVEPGYLLYSHRIYNYNFSCFIYSVQTRILEDGHH